MTLPLATKGRYFESVSMNIFQVHVHFGISFVQKLQNAITFHFLVPEFEFFNIEFDSHLIDLDFIFLNFLQLFSLELDIYRREVCFLPRG